MKNISFLDNAETRADHLRELSLHIRALEWTSASRREVEHEIPELELAMAVYRRLNAEGTEVDASGAEAFLSIAEKRVVHLRQLTHHMHSLEWLHASLTEVENEIPELELATAVYRRLTGETEGNGTGTAAKRAAPAPRARTATPRSPREDDDDDGGDDAAPAPSFTEFAMQHLDPPVADAKDADRALESVPKDPNGSKGTF